MGISRARWDLKKEPVSEDAGRRELQNIIEAGTSRDDATIVTFVIAEKNKRRGAECYDRKRNQFRENMNIT